ncbi:BTAD domain-containing putative transcriptional regulator [Streptomyces asoensis]|uniref:BTAD domain-containing putative transcriptional regulator n=1 Tax=Streptomyces asoensis TaxID=249586 RepID=UPI00340F1597
MSITPHVRLRVLCPLKSWAGDRQGKAGGPFDEQVLTVLPLEPGHSGLISGPVQAAREKSANHSARQVPNSVAELGWRPLSDRVDTVFERQPLSATEQRFAVGLDQGSGSGLVDELRGTVTARCEVLHTPLLLARFRAGRQAGAPEEFVRLHTFLSGKSGLAPGPARMELSERILRADPDGRDVAATRCTQELANAMSTMAPCTAISVFRTVLLVLAEGADEGQIRSLLPAPPGRYVLVTSRVRSPELEGAEELALGLLGDEDGVEVVRRIFGAEYVPADPEEAAQLVRLCSRLWLALQVLAARLRHHPHRPVCHMTGLLGEQKGAGR